MRFLQKDEPWYKCLVVALGVVTLLMFAFTLFVNFSGPDGFLDIGKFSSKAYYFDHGLCYTYLCICFLEVKGGCAHFDMCIFQSNLINLDI